MIMSTTCEKRERWVRRKVPSLVRCPGSALRLARQARDRASTSKRPTRSIPSTHATWHGHLRLKSTPGRYLFDVMPWPNPAPVGSGSSNQSALSIPGHPRMALSGRGYRRLFPFSHRFVRPANPGALSHEFAMSTMVFVPLVQARYEARDR